MRNECWSGCNGIVIESAASHGSSVMWLIRAWHVNRVALNLVHSRFGIGVIKETGRVRAHRVRLWTEVQHQC